MNDRRLMYLFATVTVFLFVCALGFAVVGAIHIGPGQAAERLGTLCGICIGADIVVGFTWGCWQDDRKIPPRMNRADRKKLAAEQSRIKLEKEINRLEIEAGIKEAPRDNYYDRPHYR